MYHRLVIIRNEKLFTNAHLEFSFALLIQLRTQSITMEPKPIGNCIQIFLTLLTPCGVRRALLEDAKCE